MLFWPDAALQSHSRGSVLSYLTRNKRVLTSNAAANGRFLELAAILFPSPSSRSGRSYLDLQAPFAYGTSVAPGSQR